MDTRNSGRSSHALFFRAFSFAHRARCAAAIFLRAAADIVFFFGMATTFRFCGPLFARAFAHRALWAAAILALTSPPTSRDPSQRGERSIEALNSLGRLIPLFFQLLDDRSQVSH
jgi:hypothetical protein